MSGSKPIVKLDFADNRPRINREEISAVKRLFHKDSEEYFDSIAGKSGQAFKMSAIGVFLMKDILSEFGAELSEVVIKRNENGRPCVINSDIDFSVSHSGGFVMCGAVKGGRIGCDIQAEKNFPSGKADSLAPRFMNEKELELYGAAEDKSAFLFSAWAKKEAYLKCAGGSVWNDLRALPCEKLPCRKIERGGKRAFYAVCIGEA